MAARNPRSGDGIKATVSPRTVDRGFADLCGFARNADCKTCFAQRRKDAKSPKSPHNPSG